MPSATEKTPWKMNKGEIVDALLEMKVPFRKEWTLPELRATLIEEREARGIGKPKSLAMSAMKLGDLEAKCRQEGIPLPPGNFTRGTLMKLLRDNAPPNQGEEVNFGRYKGYTYKEVPEDYLKWAMAEVEANKNHSMDLARLARWAQARDSAGGSSSGYVDPEEAAVIPPPAKASTAARRSTPTKKEKEMVLAKEENKALRTSRTRPIADVTEQDWSEVDKTTDEEIQDLEARVELMKKVREAEKKKEADAKKTQA